MSEVGEGITIDESRKTESGYGRLRKSLNNLRRRIFFEQREEDANEKVGGVPLAFFRKKRPFEEVVTTDHGRELKCEFSDKSIKIIDAANPDYRFIAELKRFDGKNVISFLVNTRNSNRSYKDEEEGFRHPDLYPAQLLEQTFEYFNRKGGSDNLVQGIYATWLSSMQGGISSNYEEYKANLAALGKPAEEITDEDRKNAARNTWTGRQASNYGFTNVTSLQEGEDGNYVSMLFDTPRQDLVVSS